MENPLHRFLEALIACVCVAIVAAVLFPVFARSHGCARCITGASNLKQIGLGLEQYVQDNNETLPPVARTRADTWRVAIYPYIKSKDVFQCPDRDLHDHATNPVGYDGFPSSYAANNAGDNTPGRPIVSRGAFSVVHSHGASLADADDTPHLIAVMETTSNSASAYNIDDPLLFSPASGKFWAGHHGGSNFLFLDGHVKWLQPLDTAQFWYAHSGTPLSANAQAVLADAQKRYAQ